MGTQNSFPYDADGKIATSTGDVMNYSNGLPLTADGKLAVSVDGIAQQPASALPALTGAPDQTWVNDVLIPFLVNAGLLAPEEGA
jgi:hypothetical protein